MMSLKQQRANKFLRDYFIVGSSSDLPTPVWNHRKGQWVEPTDKIRDAFTQHPHFWIVDIIVARPTEEEEEVSVDIETYSVGEPSNHTDIVSDIIEAHAKLLKGKEEILAVGWVMRVVSKEPPVELIWELIGGSQ